MDKMTVDSAPTSGSSNLVTSGGVYTAINNKADASALSTLQNTVNTIDTYAIKSAGTSGQVWTSDGSGAGKWAEIPNSAPPVADVNATFKSMYKNTSASADYIERMIPVFSISWNANTSAIGNKTGTLVMSIRVSCLTTSSDTTPVVSTRNNLTYTLSNEILKTGYVTVYIPCTASGASIVSSTSTSGASSRSTAECTAVNITV